MPERLSRRGATTLQDGVKCVSQTRRLSDPEAGRTQFLVGPRRSAGIRQRRKKEKSARERGMRQKEATKGETRDSPIKNRARKSNLQFPPSASTRTGTISHLSSHRIASHLDGGLHLIDRICRCTPPGDRGSPPLILLSLSLSLSLSSLCLALCLALSSLLRRQTPLALVAPVINQSLHLHLHLSPSPSLHTSYSPLFLSYPSIAGIDSRSRATGRTPASGICPTQPVLALCSLVRFLSCALFQPVCLRGPIVPVVGLFPVPLNVSLAYGRASLTSELCFVSSSDLIFFFFYFLLSCRLTLVPRFLGRSR